MSYGYNSMDGFDTYITTELGLSQETLSAYKRDVQEFLDFIGTQTLTAQLIEIFVNHLKQRGLKSTTVRRKCMSVRCLCHHLIGMGRLDSNILGMINSIRIDRRTSDALDSKDVDTLISAVGKRTPLLRTANIRRDVTTILTLYHSGLRASELCGLNLDDIDFSRRTIRVRGKGNCDRIVPTTPRCAQAIMEYIDLERKSETNAIFVTTNGQRITRRAVSDMLTSLSCRAGIKHTTAHMLRRSCATSLMNSGMDLELIQVLLGHQNLSTTQTYLVTTLDRLKNIHQCCHPLGAKYEA